MLPWSNKAGSSSSTSSSIRRDETIANTHQYRSTSEAESTRFRSSLAQDQSTDNTGFDTFVQSSSSSSFTQQPFPPVRESHVIHHPPPPPPASAAMDGAEVLGILSSAEYTDAIHGDDLVQESHTYRSHRHQTDHEHSAAEHHRHQWTELLAAEDIVAYLQALKYTDDIYGAPPAIESLIKEAQQEIMDPPRQEIPASNHTAVSRLAMVRDHLLGHAQGQVEAAAKHAHEMKQDDWDQIFSKGGLL